MIQKCKLLVIVAAVCVACKGETVTVTSPPVVEKTADSVATPSRFGSAWSMAPDSPVDLATNNGHFMDAWFINANEGWVTGFPSPVYHTIDGGAHWELVHATDPSGTRFARSMVFVSPTLGWVGDLNSFRNPAAHASLYETRDGGHTFTNITAKVQGPDPVGICGMYSVDATMIVGVGRWHGPAVFVRTTDGGETWQSVSLAPMLTGAVDVYFFDRLHGIIAGGRGVSDQPADQMASHAVVLSTDDGGTTWTERYVSTHAGHWLWKISFPSRQVGYIAAQGPSDERLVIKTIDGGTTWSEIVIKTKAPGFDGAGFISENVGWISADTVTFETLDGGKTWAASPVAKGEDVNRYRILPSGAAFAVGRHVFRYLPP